MSGGKSHGLLTRASVEDVIEPLLQKVGSLLDGAQHHLVRLRIQVLGEQLGEKGGGSRRLLGRLEDGRAASSDGSDHGSESEGEGDWSGGQRRAGRPAVTVSEEQTLLTIPGANDENGTSSTRRQMVS